MAGTLGRAGDKVCAILCSSLLILRQVSRPGLGLKMEIRVPELLWTRITSAPRNYILHLHGQIPTANHITWDSNLFSVVCIFPSVHNYERYPLEPRYSVIMCTLSVTLVSLVLMWISGFSGASYGADIPVKSDRLSVSLGYVGAFPDL